MHWQGSVFLHIGRKLRLDDGLGHINLYLKDYVISVIDLKMNFILSLNAVCEPVKDVKYIDSHYWNRPSMFKCIELVRSGDTRITNLEIYIYKAFKVRNAEMYSEID